MQPHAQAVLRLLTTGRRTERASWTRLLGGPDRRAGSAFLDRASPDGSLSKQEPALEQQQNSNLYVNNLAPEVDDATLAEAFGGCGHVISACVWRDQSTKQR